MSVCERMSAACERAVGIGWRFFAADTDALLSHAQMFALLAQVKTNQLSGLGSVGVEGGQGDADNLFGSHDDHGQLGVSSGAGDINDKYFSTGDIYVSSQASCMRRKERAVLLLVDAF